MKILALCPRAPFPPDRGDRLRSYHLLRRLGENHEIHLACPDGGTLGKDRREGIGNLCDQYFVHHLSPFRRGVHALRSFLGDRPISLGWFHEAQVASTVKQWCAETPYDVALVSQTKMAPYWLREHRRHGLPAVVDLVDVASEDFGERATYINSPRKWVYRREQWLMARYEQEVARQARGVVVVSEAEAELLRSRVDVPVEVIENGVDGGSFERPALGGSPSPRRVVFVGRLVMEANAVAVRWYVNQVHPRVRAQCEQVVFEALGAHPIRELRALRKRPDIYVPGWVEDLRPHLWRASVAVAPLRIPTGTTNGVLEAMASSVPVVATPAAARGLVQPSGDHIAVAESPVELAGAICRLLADPARARAQCAAALEYVRRNHSWDRAAEKLETQLLRAAKGDRA